MPRAFILILAILFLHGALAQEQHMQQHLRIPSGVGSLRLFVRHQSPDTPSSAAPVLLIHGATFPSGNAAAWKIDGRSWMDELAAAGFEVYALDFAGYGESDRYEEMTSEAAQGPPLGDINSLIAQVDAAVAYIRKTQAATRVNLIAHSAGTLVAARYARLHSERVARLVLFGAPAPHPSEAHAATAPLRYFQKTTSDQLNAFEDKSRLAGRLDEQMFERWAQAYLASDPHSGERQPASVRVPAGMSAALDAMNASNKLPYDPAQVTRPTLLIQGEWDAVSPPADAMWIFQRLAAPLKRIITLSQGGHRLHLEASRLQLYREVNTFLTGRDGGEQ